MKVILFTVIYAVIGATASAIHPRYIEDHGVRESPSLTP